MKREGKMMKKALCSVSLSENKKLHIDFTPDTVVSYEYEDRGVRHNGFVGGGRAIKITPDSIDICLEPCSEYKDLCLSLNPSVTAVLNGTQYENVGLIILKGKKLALWPAEETFGQTDTPDASELMGHLNDQIIYHHVNFSKLRSSLADAIRRNKDVESELEKVQQKNKDIQTQIDMQVDENAKQEKKLKEHRDKKESLIKEIQEEENRVEDLSKRLEEARSTAQLKDDEFVSCCLNIQKRICELIDNIKNTTQLTENDIKTIEAMHINEFVPNDRIDELKSKYETLKASLNELYLELTSVSSDAEMKGLERDNHLNEQDNT